MKSIGNYGELKAANHLISSGFKIIKKNFYTRFGELDIIAQKGHSLHIIEVKFLTSAYIHSGYKINRKKRIRMIRCTQLFIDQYNIKNAYIQFDLIMLNHNQIKHLKNIFNLSDV